MSGHGHVYRRLDGTKVRCGGPGLCPECQRDLERLGASGIPVPDETQAFIAELQACFDRIGIEM